MKVRPIPANTLAALSALLCPYCPDASPTAIVQALQAHGGTAPDTDPAARRSLSLKESGRALGLSEWTIRRMVLDGRIRGRKLGAQWRVPLAEIESLAAAGAEA